jgi:hypothetical protein
MSNVFYTPLSFKYFLTFWVELVIMLINFLKYTVLKF